MKNDIPDIGRLCQAIYHARLALRYPRQERFNAVRQYVGKHWSEEGTSKEVPLNLIGAYVSIVGRKLIAHNPRVGLSTWNRKAKPTVKAMEDWANQEIEDLNLQNTLQRVVIDALFSVGICKVALATPADSALAAWSVKAGEPVAMRIDLDDFVFDHHARDFSEVSFIGHRFRAPLAVIRDSKIYSKDRKELVASSDPIYNMEGDERIGLLGRTTVGGDEEFEDYVDLWEIYLPRHKLIVTIAEDQISSSMTSEGKMGRNYGKALRIQKWLGPDSGPYHILGFGVVPGNTMPKAPVQDLIDLHEAVNRILRKLIREADAYKKVHGVRGGSTEDADRLMAANDGDFAKVNNPQDIVPIESGGPSQVLMQFFLAMKELFSWLAGNLDIMGGLSPQAKTAHQDAMLNQNSTATVGEMQQRTVDLTSSVVEAMCWYWHHHPTKVQRSEFSLPGLPGISSVRRVFPNHPKHYDPRHPHFRRKKALVRNHAFEAMKIQVDPFSMQHQTPQEQAQAIDQVITSIYLPMAQMAKEQGINLDLNEYFARRAKLLNQPGLQDILTIQEPPPDQGQSGGGGAEGPGMPQNTSREYVRRSLGGTPAGQQQNLMQQLASGMSQQNGQAPKGAA